MNPTAAIPAWSTPAPTASTALSDLACPSTGLCFAAGAQTLGGRKGVSALISTDPMDSAPTWLIPQGFPGRSDDPETPATVSCASTSLCVLVLGESGLITTDPADEHPVWRPTHIVELPTGSVSLRGFPIARGSTLAFRLDCVAEWIEECRGAAKVTATERLAPNGRTITGVGLGAKGRHRRSVVIGRSTFATGFGGNGKAYTIVLRLNRTGNRLLARFKRIRATLSITTAASELRVPPKIIPVTAVGVTFRANVIEHRRR
jgi:hypothetical protein